jgi:ABC-type siderophore export system fused ATPase/permease subunit
MTANLTQLLEKVATLPDVIQEEIALQWLDDIENELQWQATLEQPQPKLEQLALAALQQAKQDKTIKKGFDEL